MYASERLSTSFNNWDTTIANQARDQYIKNQYLVYNSSGGASHHKQPAHSKRVSGNTAIKVDIRVPVEPPKQKGFIPRETLYSKLVGFLTDCKVSAQEGENRWLLLHGLGGSGKTQICAKFYREYKVKFDHAIWLRGASPATLLKDLRAVAEKAELAVDDLVANFRAWLSKVVDKGSTWLLVLDNWSREIMNAEYSIFPDGGTGSGCIIVTSNENLEEATLSIAMRDHELLVQEGISLLLEITDKQGCDGQELTDAGTLVKNLNCLVLAIAVAAEDIRVGRYNIHDYLKTWQQAFGSGCDSQNELDTVFKLVWNRLQTICGGGSAMAVELLSIMSFLQPHQIQISIFEKAWTEAQKFNERNFRDISYRNLQVFAHREPTMIQASTDIFRVELMRCLHLLGNRSLLHCDDRNIQMHSLFQQWVRFHHGSHLNGVYERWWSSAVCSVALAMRQMRTDSDINTKDSFFREMVPHIKSLLACMKPHGILDEKALFRVCISNESSLTSGATLFADALSVSGYYLEALELRRKVCSAMAEQPAVFTLEKRVDASWLLGHTYQDLGRHRDAHDAFMCALQLQRQAGNSSPVAQLELEAAVAESSWKLGQTSHARTLMARVLEQYELMNSDSKCEVTIRMVHGHWKAAKRVAFHMSEDWSQNNTVHSVREISQCAKKLQRIANDNQLDRLKHDMLCDQSEFAQSFSDNGYHRDAFDLRRSVWEERQKEDKDHPDALLAAVDFAKSATSLGYNEVALNVLEKSCSGYDAMIKTGRLSNFHPDVLAAKFDYAQALLMAEPSQRAEAIQLHEHVLDLRSKSSINDQTEVLASMKALVLAYLSGIGSEHSSYTIEQSVKQAGYVCDNMIEYCEREFGNDEQTRIEKAELFWDARTLWAVVRTKNAKYSYPDDKDVILTEYRNTNKELNTIAAEQSQLGKVAAHVYTTIARGRIKVSESEHYGRNTEARKECLAVAIARFQETDGMLQHLHDAHPSKNEYLWDWAKACESRGWFQQAVPVYERLLRVQVETLHVSNSRCQRTIDKLSSEPLCRFTSKDLQDFINDLAWESSLDSDHSR